MAVVFWVLLALAAALFLYRVTRRDKPAILPDVPPAPLPLIEPDAPVEPEPQPAIEPDVPSEPEVIVTPEVSEPEEVIVPSFDLVEDVPVSWWNRLRQAITPKSPEPQPTIAEVIDLERHPEPQVFEQPPTAPRSASRAPRAAPTSWSTSNYLTRSGIIRNGENMLITGWLNTIDATTRTMWDQGISGQTTHRRVMTTPGSARVRTESNSAGGASAQTAATVPTSGWVAWAGAFVSSTLRSAYYSGGNQVDNTTSITPNAPNTLRIGINCNTLLPYHPTGSIAAIGVWDITGFSDSDIDSLVSIVHTLVNGSAPNPVVLNAQVGQVWSGKLMAFWPMDINDTNPWNDISGNGHHMTMQGTLTAFASYPPMDTATVSAAMTGTIFGSNEPRIEPDIVSGGRTIILTLQNTTWVTSGATFNAERQNIINGLTAATTQTHGWNNDVKAALAVTDVVRTSDTVVTITLPAVGAYDISAQEVITATIPATAIGSGVALVATPTITIHPVPTTTRRATAGWSVANVPNPLGNYLTGPAFVTGPGFYVSQWINMATVHKAMPWQLGKNNVLSHHWRTLISPAPGDFFAAGSWWNPTGEVSGDPGFDSGQDHTGDQAIPQVIPQTGDYIEILTNRWFHTGAAFISTSNRWAWLYGDLTTEDQSTTLATPNTPTETRIGVRVDQADGFESGDQTAEISVWDISAMTIAEIRTLNTALSTLTDGVAPNPRTLNAQVGQVWSGKLISCPDLDKTSGTWRNDLSGHHAAYTQVGTLTTGSSYPPVAEFVSSGNSGMMLLLGVG